MDLGPALCGMRQSVPGEEKFPEGQFLTFGSLGSVGSSCKNVSFFTNLVLVAT